MEYVVFKSKPRQTPFAPEWNYFVCHANLENIDFDKIAKIILIKEKEILKTTKSISESAFYTELGANSLTSRSGLYNVFDWVEEPEIVKLKQAIFDKYTLMMQELKLYQPKTWIQCWANVLRKDQEIKMHLHSVHEWSYLSGHVTIQCADTSTVYVNPINPINDPEIYDAKNKSGNLSFFFSNMPHYTTKHKSDEERITIAFDLQINEPESKNKNIIVFE